MSDTDATQARQYVVAEVDEIIEHVINANMLNMPYDVYSELFDAVDGLGVALEKMQAENTKLRKLVRDMMEFFEDGDWCVKCERALDCQEQEQYEDECLMRFVFRGRMRELGVDE